MEPERLLGTLRRSGIVEDDGDSIELTEPFHERRSAVRTELAAGNGPIDERLVAACAGVESDTDAETAERHLLATASAIGRMTDLSTDATAAAAIAVRRVERPPATDGAPEGFTALRGEEVGAFLASNPTAVLYFWGYDCDPCDSVRTTFETLRANGAIPDDVALAAVCSEDCHAAVGDRYQVAVVPTVIFCADGRPDSRIVGIDNRAAFRSELEIIADG
jgi:thiol-disulfide isomerase/thioredoxin